MLNVYVVHILHNIGCSDVFKTISFITFTILIVVQNTFTIICNQTISIR